MKLVFLESIASSLCSLFSVCAAGIANAHTALFITVEEGSMVQSIFITDGRLYIYLSIF